jgi:ornithine carbamoyltransferase
VNGDVHGAAPADRHLLGVLDLGPEGLAALLRTVDELRDGWFRPVGRLIGANVSLAERHIRCGVRDAATMLGCVLVDGSWDELEARCAVAALTAPESGPAALIGVDPDHARLAAVAARSPVPVINAGSNRHQPVQVLADLLTLRDFIGSLRGRHLLLAEDDLALRRSWAEACVLAGIRCTVAEVTTNGLLGPEFADAVAHADLFGGELLPISQWGVSLGDVDVVIGSGRGWHRWVTDIDLLRGSETDTIVIPGRMDAEDAAPGHAGAESARAVLYHRSRNVTTVGAALIRERVDAALAHA